jgi:hypothetical protein
MHGVGQDLKDRLSQPFFSSRLTFVNVKSMSVVQQSCWNKFGLIFTEIKGQLWH